MSEHPSNSRLICPDCGEVYDRARGTTCPEDGARLQNMAVSENDPLIGETLESRFSIQERVGEGSMARVFRATQLSVHREVALKILTPTHASDEVIVERFYREAQIISDFSHPNIVRLIDFGRDEERDLLYLAMEHVDGYPVERLAQRGRLLPELAVELATQICAALAEVHSHGVVHRDLKPENLMVVPRADGELEVKLLDFGIAHALQRADGFTEPGAVWGTPHYLSPEQAESDEVGPYSDIYSLGILLFEMLTGRAPTTGEKSIEILHEHVEGDLPDIREFLDDDHVCDDLVALVRRMLETRPADRPQHVLEVRQMLREIAEKREYDECLVDPSTARETMFSPYVRAPAPRSQQETPRTPAGRPRVETSRTDKSSRRSDSRETEPEINVPVPSSDSAAQNSTLPLPSDNAGGSASNTSDGPTVVRPPGPPNAPIDRPEEPDPATDHGRRRQSWVLLPLGILLAAGGGLALHFGTQTRSASVKPNAQSGRTAHHSSPGDRRAPESAPKPRRRDQAASPPSTPDSGAQSERRNHDGPARGDHSVDTGSHSGDVGPNESSAESGTAARAHGAGRGRPAEPSDDESFGSSPRSGPRGAASGGPDPPDAGRTDPRPTTEDPPPPPARVAERQKQSEPPETEAESDSEPDARSSAPEPPGSAPTNTEPTHPESTEPEPTEPEKRIDPGLYPVE